MAEDQDILRFFEYEHLPEYLQEVAQPFSYLAQDMAERQDLDADEAQAGVRKLLEAKDCFVRAALRDEEE